MVQVAGFGTFDADKLRRNIGRVVGVGAKAFLVLTPSARDFPDTMEREAQILAAKDIASVLYAADIAAGCRVVEAGSGSGALTIALARAVGPTGRVLSFELRPQALRVARLNVESAGLQDRVEFRHADVRKGIVDRNLDAVVLDMPDPWNAVSQAWEALRPCGHLVTFSPNVEQVKDTVAAIRARPFVDVRTVEVFERDLELRELGTRPSSAPLGHTGYITSAMKVLESL